MLPRGGGLACQHDSMDPPQLAD